MYRLLKASRPDAIDTEEQRRPALLLLAVLFGQPVLAAELYRGLHEHSAPFDRRDEALAAAIRRHTDGKDAASPERADWEMLLCHVEALQGRAVTVGQCRAAPQLLARYSLVTGHEWHLWRAPSAASQVPTAMTA